MTAKARLISSPEIKRVIAAARAAGIEIGGIDVRADCVRIIAPGSPDSGTSAYDQWKDKSGNRAARR